MGISSKSNREAIGNLLTLTQREIGNLCTNPLPLAKCASPLHLPPPPTPSGPQGGSGGASAPPPGPSAAPAEDKYKYKCNICNKGFQRSNELQNHQVAVHGDGFQCVHCDHTPFNSKSALNVHMKTKHGVGSSKMYSCEQCNYTSNRNDALLAHRVKQYAFVVPDEDMQHCPNEGCNQKFLTKEQLSRYLRLICQKGADVPCDEPSCSRTFKNRQQMMAHYPIHTDEGKGWFCKECQKQLSSKQAYNQHMQRHT